MGYGYAPAHHGELLQGAFEDQAGQLRRALVTLPLPGRGSRATFYPSNHRHVAGGPEFAKSQRAAVLTLQELSWHPAVATGGRIEITSDIPRGVGMGSSTSDVTATIRAVADCHRVRLSREVVGRLAVRAECASDSIMIDDRVVLFAHRDGMTLENLGRRLPPLVVVGCDTSPGTSVDTLRLQPADYRDDEVATFRKLRAGLRRAIATGDVALLGQVSTVSAQINQRFLPKPILPSLLELCRRLNGSGVQVAHSGTVAGLIFDARQPGIEAAVSQCVAGIEERSLAATAIIYAPSDRSTPAPVGMAGRAGVFA